MSSKLITLKQAAALRELGYPEPTIRYAYNTKNHKLVLPVPTVDEAIDWLRRKYHVMVYNRVAPYVDPVEKRIKYGYAVKYCDIKWGWNQRILLERAVYSADCYAAKRKAIAMAIRFIKKQKNAEARRCRTIRQR